MVSDNYPKEIRNVIVPFFDCLAVKQAPKSSFSVTVFSCFFGGGSVTALLFKMEEANITNRAKAQEFIQATNQVSE